jgi:hypothetical protein
VLALGAAALALGTAAQRPGVSSQPAKPDNLDGVPPEIRMRPENQRFVGKLERCPAMCRIEPARSALGSECGQGMKVRLGDRNPSRVAEKQVR